MKRRTFLGAVSGAATLATLGGAVPAKRERLTGWKREIDREIRDSATASWLDNGAYLVLEVPIGFMSSDLGDALIGKVNRHEFGGIGAGCLSFEGYSIDRLILPYSISARSAGRFRYRVKPWNENAEGLLVYAISDFGVIPDASEEEYRKWRRETR